MKPQVDIQGLTEIMSSYQIVRARSEALCAPLKVEDYIPQPVEFVSPPKWHLAHTTWFFETFVLQPHLPGYKVFDEDFSFLFNSYYNAVGTRVFRADRGNMTRPGVEEVFAYRAYVNKHVIALLEANRGDRGIEDLVILGLQHEQQHQELLITDLKYILGHNPIFPVYDPDFTLVGQEGSENGYHTIGEGVYEIGYAGDGFHFDNELGRHKCYLHTFEIANGLLTNGTFLEFIQDGGYEHPHLWLDEGWTWKNQNKKSHPLYWHQIDGSWFQYTLAGLLPLRENELLCHINFYEAAAFAEWAGHRLPTEFEWEVAQGSLRWGERWEWTNSAYLPYPGFVTAPGALGEYNGKFMINQMVLRGASAATTAGHSRATYRNFFHPHLAWQCSGIRLVKK